MRAALPKGKITLPSDRLRQDALGRMAEENPKASSLWPGSALMYVALGMLLFALVTGILRGPAPAAEVRWLAPLAPEVETP